MVSHFDFNRDCKAAWKCLMKFTSQIYSPNVWYFPNLYFNLLLLEGSLLECAQNWLKIKVTPKYQLFGLQKMQYLNRIKINGSLGAMKSFVKKYKHFPDNHGEIEQSFWKLFQLITTT